MGRKKKQTVGYRYRMTLHLGICQGPVDAVVQIDADDKPAWRGTGQSTLVEPIFRDVKYNSVPIRKRYNAWKKDHDAYLDQLRNVSASQQGTAITESSVTRIDAYNLFGGDEKEGGLSGELHICMGEKTQAPNPILVAQLGQPMPAYRALLGLVFKGMISANSPYIKNWQVTVRRVLKGWRDDTPWYAEKAQIGQNMNPIHIIYQCLTDDDWGMGYPTTAIDEVSFKAAADVLFNEGFGLSLIWTRQAAIGSFLQEVFNHIGGTFRIHPQSGLYQIKLLRYDYLPAQLPIFDPNNISELSSFQRAGWGETVNELTVVYTAADTFKETSITVHNLANIQAQGGVVQQKINYHGITSADIAKKVALRDLLVKSSPLARVKLKINRQAWHLLPYDVFILNWPKLGLNGVIVRVINVGTGTLDGGLIEVEAVEDVFGLPQNSYLNQQGGGWMDESAPAAPAVRRVLTELAYYDLARALNDVDLNALHDDETYPCATAKANNGLALDFKLLLSSSDQYSQADTAPHSYSLSIGQDLPVEEHSTINVLGLDDSQLSVGDYLLLGAEYLRLDGIEPDLNLLYVARGVADTVPQAHSSGALLFAVDGFWAANPVQPWPVGGTVNAKIITTTSRDELPTELAPVDTLLLRGRHALPIAPAKIRINGDYLPQSVRGAVHMAWNTRNRVLQADHLMAQDEDAILPENGQTVGVRIYNQNGVLSRTLTGLSASSYIYPVADELADCGGLQSHLTLQIYAERDGLESWQYQQLTFERVYSGFGFDFGSHWGGV